MTSVNIWPLLLLSFSLLSLGKDCSFPVLNGKIILSPESIQKNHFPDHSNASVVCAKGLERESGSDLIICMDGTWSAVELKCKKIDCGLPKASPHMHYSIPNGTLFGAFIKPYCERRYDLEGSSHIQCLVNGWNGDSECILITCDDEPASIAHGTFSKPREIPEFDDVIEYSCEDNYTLVGNSSITCGYWTYTSPPPTCKEIKCPVPEISFGNQTKGNPPYFYKSEATFECWPGYRMKGLATSVCEESGWSGLPVCDKVITTQTTASTTTNKATTATATATTHSNGRNGDQHITHSLSSCLAISMSVILAFFAAFLCIFFVYRNSKQRGSYSTGEERRTKEELLLYQSL